LLLQIRIVAALLAALCVTPLAGQTPVWKFAVSGDSRNCGDIVMPAIAAAVVKTDSKFYWHLGDFRAIYDFDEDMVPPASLGLNAPHVTIASYLDRAWPDFIDRQLHAFGNLEIFLGIGNHETIPPKGQQLYLKQFDPYLNTPRLRSQRQQDPDSDKSPQTYYHWIMNGSTDFLTLDNSVGNGFDERQLAWIRGRLQADGKNQAIRTIVVGMHEALPGSKGLSHSMCDSKDGIRTGREVYELLWNLQQAGKKVYVLASHSHFIMDDVYRTPYWGDHVLPGWIVGTAGAVRYRLPPSVAPGKIARTDVYGYLLATVMSDGSIDFAFQELSLDDLRAANAGKNPDSLVRWCFTQNADQRIPVATTCAAN
jgi:hypothetical protein